MSEVDLSTWKNTPKTDQQLGEFLIDAARIGNLSQIKQLIARNIPIDIQREGGWTASVLATANNRLEVVLELIKADASLDVGTQYRIMLLMLVIVDCHLNAIRKLIGNSVKLNHRNIDGDTALMIASENGYSEIVQALIKDCANIDMQNKLGMTALMFASTNGELGVVQLLLQAGANIDIQDRNGYTALILSKDKEIKNLITKYKIIRENIGNLINLQKNKSVYFYWIPCDIVGLIKNQLSDENFY